MPDNGDAILDAVNKLHDKMDDVQKTSADIQTKVSSMDQHLNTLNGTVKKHEDVLYGDPKRSGEGGLIHTTQAQEGKIKGIGKRLDNVRSTFVMIGTIVLAAMQLSISAVRHWFGGGN